MEQGNDQLENERILEQYKDAVDKANIVSKTTPKGIITYVNKFFCDISGYTKEELLGKPHNIVRHPENPKRLFHRMWETLHSKQVWNGVLKNKSKEGKTYYVDTCIVPIVNDQEIIEEYIAIRHDITELMELRLLTEREKIKFERLASIDCLTKISNRMQFLRLLEGEFQAWQVKKLPFSLILIDIDMFKQINDTYGHPVGDQVLVEFSELIKAQTRKIDIFGRIGGEEFGLVVKADQTEAMIFAERIRATIEQYVFSKVKHITASLGVSQMKEGLTKEMLVKNADDALYNAKRNGRNCVVVK